MLHEHIQIMPLTHSIVVRWAHLSPVFAAAYEGTDCVYVHIVALISHFIAFKLPFFIIPSKWIFSLNCVKSKWDLQEPIFLQTFCFNSQPLNLFMIFLQHSINTHWTIYAYSSRFEYLVLGSHRFEIRCT